MTDRAMDRRAVFEEEAIPHLTNLYRSALRLLRDPEQAGDAVQETFLVAWKSFDRYAAGTNCKAWLYQILFNVVRRHRRNWFKWLTGKYRDLADTSIEAPAPLPAQLSDRDILAALDRLPRQYPEVLLLVDVEEFSYAEASAALRIPIGTVMSRLSRARAELRRQLGGVAAAHSVPVSRKTTVSGR